MFAFSGPRVFPPSVPPCLQCICAIICKDFTLGRTMVDHAQIATGGITAALRAADGPVVQPLGTWRATQSVNHWIPH